jgi:enoyl-[acyl-carrier protein] reductase I
MSLETKSNILKGKKVFIMGVANDKSIAWGIAKACYENGAEIGYSYQGEVLEKRIRPLAEQTKSSLILQCDVSSDESIKNTFDQVQQQWGKVDYLVHAIAFADKNDLRGYFYDTSRDNFLLAMNISCYSFVSVCKYAQNLMSEGGSIATLTYYGAEKCIPHYNVMGVAKAALEASVRYLACDLGARGIRVNAISAGPIKTLAASGIGDFSLMSKWNEANAPLKRNVTIDDVGGCGVFLASDLSRSITGEVVYVDSGYNITGMAYNEELVKYCPSVIKKD